MRVRASGILEYVIDIQSEIFSREAINKIDEFTSSHKLTPALFLETSAKTDEAINELVLAPSPDVSRAYLDIIEPRILSLVYMRFQYFEDRMRELSKDASASVELHSGVLIDGDDLNQLQNLHQDFLRFGLIDLWKNRLVQGPYYRLN